MRVENHLARHPNRAAGALDHAVHDHALRHRPPEADPPAHRPLRDGDPRPLLTHPRFLHAKGNRIIAVIQKLAEPYATRLIQTLSPAPLVVDRRHEPSLGVDAEAQGVVLQLQARLAAPGIGRRAEAGDQTPVATRGHGGREEEIPPVADALAGHRLARLGVGQAREFRAASPKIELHRLGKRHRRGIPHHNERLRAVYRRAQALARGAFQAFCILARGLGVDPLAGPRLAVAVIGRGTGGSLRIERVLPSPRAQPVGMVGVELQVGMDLIHARRGLRIRRWFPLERGISLCRIQGALCLAILLQRARRWIGAHHPGIGEDTPQDRDAVAIARFHLPEKTTGCCELDRRDLARGVDARDQFDQALIGPAVIARVLEHDLVVGIAVVFQARLKLGKSLAGGRHAVAPASRQLLAIGWDQVDRGQAIHGADSGQLLWTHLPVLAQVPDQNPGAVLALEVEEIRQIGPREVYLKPAHPGDQVAYAEPLQDGRQPAGIAPDVVNGGRLDREALPARQLRGIPDATDQLLGACQLRERLSQASLGFHPTGAQGVQQPLAVRAWPAAQVLLHQQRRLARPAELAILGEITVALAESECPIQMREVLLQHFAWQIGVADIHVRMVDEVNRAQFHAGGVPAPAANLLFTTASTSARGERHDRPVSCRR